MELNELKRSSVWLFERSPYKWVAQRRRCFFAQFEKPGEVDHVVRVDDHRRLCDEKHGFFS